MTQAFGPTDPRRIAAQSLLRVLRDDAWAAALLDAEFSSLPQLDVRDRALATELVYGTLRAWSGLEHALLALTKTRAFPDDMCKVHMIMAAHQIKNLGRVPAFAAVDRAVGAISKERGPKVAAFANAVLRKYATACAEAPPEPADAPQLSVPAWLERALKKSLGEGDSQAFLRASAAAPPVALALADASDTDALFAELKGRLPQAEARVSTLVPGCIVLGNAGPLGELPGHGTRFWIQEEGSQWVAQALGAQPGDRVLDACAGRGHKTAMLARAVGETGTVDACDLHESKLTHLARELGRVGLEVGETHPVDLSVGTGELQPGYARILLDAPCTGVGTLRRRPEIALRRTPASIREHQALQVQILTNVAKLLAPGGTLLYAVCSVLRAECEDVVDQVIAADPSLTLSAWPVPPAPGVAPGACTVRLLPHVHGTDGYFVARIARA